MKNIEKVNQSLNELVHNIYEPTSWKSSIEGEYIIIRPVHGTNTIHSIDQFGKFADVYNLGCFCTWDETSIKIVLI